MKPLCFAVRLLPVAIALGLPVAQAASPAQSAVQSNCHADFVRQVFAQEPLVKVINVRAYSRGEHLQKTPTELYAQANLCAVKLLVGPGTPGPADAPSTQAGIGIEVWLPTAADWSGRIHNLGGGGFVGVPQVTATDAISPRTSHADEPAVIAGRELSVTAATDTGHVSQPVNGRPNRNGSFLLLPDGSINTTQWQDYSERGIHEMAVRSKQLTTAYYGQPARYSYFEGCSTGGRQANKYAQRFPDDYDGIVAGAAAFNFTRFSVAGVYPQIAMQRELGHPLAPEKLARASAAAVSACDSSLTGQHEGFISDPASCSYDPTRDLSLLCSADGGHDSSSACLSKVEAQVVNRIWFGQTRDGSAPDPIKANGFSAQLEKDQLWFGTPRGTLLMNAESKDGKAKPSPISMHIVALIEQNGRLADPGFVNAAGNGESQWKKLSYSDLARISERGVALQKEFAQINTDSTDLRAFKARGGKIIAFHGLSDPAIPPQGTAHYVETLTAAVGKADLDEFYRFYPIPGMGHCGSSGTAPGLDQVSPPADPPLPKQGQLFASLVDWVEKGQAPQSIIVSNSSGSLKRPLCNYPLKQAYKGGDVADAASYRCE